MIYITWSSGTITIPRNPSQDSRAWIIMEGASSVWSGSGCHLAQAPSRKIHRADIRVDLVKKEIADLVQNMISRSIRFTKEPFSIECASFDFGLGMGVRMDNCYLMEQGSSSSYILNRSKSLRYDLFLSFESRQQFNSDGHPLEIPRGA